MREIIPPILALIVFFAVAIFVANVISAKSCKETWKLSNMETSYSIWTDCLVKLPNGSWVPSKTIRNF